VPPSTEIRPPKVVFELPKSSVPAPSLVMLPLPMIGALIRAVVPAVTTLNSVSAPIDTCKPPNELISNSPPPTAVVMLTREMPSCAALPLTDRVATPLPLSANDPGEPARDGGLLYVRYGKGTFVYAAHAFFRQLPAGVPGAYRLFANLVSGGAPAAALP